MRMTVNVILALYLLSLPFLMRFLPDYEVYVCGNASRIVSL